MMVLDFGLTLNECRRIKLEHIHTSNKGYYKRNEDEGDVNLYELKMRKLSNILVL